MNRSFLTPAFAAGPGPDRRFGGPFRGRRRTPSGFSANLSDDRTVEPGEPDDRGPGRGGRGRGPGGHHHGPRDGGPGFRTGGRGFGGPGGPGFGPGGPGFGRGGAGGPWKRRSRRGNVRAAILALLAEEPRHGYAIMTELAERSGGLWRPSPGSVYPVLAQLQDEGLVQADDSQDRKVFTLTDAGRAHVTEHAAELHEPWVVADDRPRARVQQLMHAMGALGSAVEQVARLGDDAQSAQAAEAIDEARRVMYRILADDEPVAGSEPADR